MASLHRSYGNEAGRPKHSAAAQRDWADMLRIVRSEAALLLAEVNNLPDEDPGRRRRADVVGSTLGHAELAVRALEGVGG